MHQLHISHDLLMNLISAFSIAIAGWLCLKSPRIKKIGENALCEHDFRVLLLEIMKCKSPADAMALEESVDDFYNTYAGRAIHAKAYADELYSLITQMQYA